MVAPSNSDFRIKIQRIRTYLYENSFSGMILCRRDNFAWLSGGGDSAIIDTTEYGFGIIVVLPEKTYLIAQSMDRCWLMDEILRGLDIEPIELKWFEMSREEKALSLAGKKAVSDKELTGAEMRFNDILKLHYPLTQRDIAMYREWGELYEKTLSKVVDQIEPGMTENEIKAIGMAEFSRIQAYPTIFLIGSDDRIERFRHPVPTDKPVAKTVLIHPGMRRYGQHCLITRMFCFGEVPDKLRKDYDFLNMLQAQTLSLCKPGVGLRDIAECRRQLFFDSGREKEWSLHYPGGLTEYYVGTAQWVIDNEPILDRMCLDWYITVTGAKVEELSLIGETGPELLSVRGYWPTKDFTYNGRTFSLPDILVK